MLSRGHRKSSNFYPKVSLAYSHYISIEIS